MADPADSKLRLLLFAAVPQRSMLNQGFYAAEVDGLRAHPAVAQVVTTNSLAEVRSADVDGIVTYFYSHSAAVGVIAKARRIPVIGTGGCEQLVRNQALSVPNYLARLTAFHACTAVLDRLVATSTSDYERMRDVAIIGRDQIWLSFHGVPSVADRSPDVFSLHRAPASLVTIAGLDTIDNVRRKGVLEAVDLLARFAENNPTASLTIIGRTTRRDLVERHAKARGVLKNVHFTGYIDEREKIALLRRTRFYVQLSEYEGFGVGAIEALAQGCQILHSNVGGLRDTVADYGVVISRTAVATFDLDTIPDYRILDRVAFEHHLACFNTQHRADTLIRALGLNHITGRRGV